MSRGRCRGRYCDSSAALVDETARAAATFGPFGALLTGVFGFTVFYWVLPSVIIAWTATRQAQLTSPMASAIATLMDHIVWARVIAPCQWVAVAILLACTAIAAWKALGVAALSSDDITRTSWLSKLLARILVS
jgi:hypothetical protein